MLTTLLSTVIFINELMASNAGVVMSPASNFDSWIELYNASDEDFSLNDLYLSDNADNLMLWHMPSNMGSVPPHGFKVIWLGSNDIKTTQAPFKLDCDGGSIYLSDKNGEIITSLTYPKAMSSTAYARKTDGGDEWGWTADATPDTSNATSAFATERLDAPVVSQGSQLFSSQISVKVDIPEGATLMYTTDGSIPGAIADGTTRQSKNGQFTVIQTTNYVFRLYQNGYLPSVPVTRSFIKTSNTYTLPVISIVGNKSHFTDPKIGFDCDGDGTNGKTGNGQNWPKNYNQDWERPVNFSLLTPDGETLFSQDVNICVSGGWTRSQRFRSFKLKSGKVFDGQNHFDYSFFPQKPYIRNKVLLLRNGGNDVWTHNARFMDPALETIIQRSGIDIDVQSYVPVIEYVNGELRGVFNMREPNNDKFAYANWGYDDEELDAFENLEMKNGTDSVINRIFELGRHINDSGAYDELKTLLDIDEFTNYMAVTMFLDNDDWPNNNIKGYRSQKDGRYRFVSFDLDYAFALCGFNQHNDNPFSFFLDYKDATNVQGKDNPNREIVRLLLNLLGHDEYRRKFIDTFCVIAGSVFEPDRASAIVDELLTKVQPMTQLMKQQGIYDGHDPDRAASTIKNKLKGRSKKMAGHLKSFSYAKLTTTAQAVTMTADTEGAHLYINGINVPYAYFNGHLFAPVTLRAEAPAGYHFSGWKKGSSIVSRDEEISLPSGSSVSLTAMFTKLSDDELKADGITPVRINEVSAANDIYMNDYFKRNDWIELYNTTDQPIDVAGMFLSDNLQKPQKYQISNIPSLEGGGTVIQPHGYLIVWCDKLEALSEQHASFKLAASGGDVLLTAADESWTDRLTYTAMNGDQTVGRYPDGQADIMLMNIPTIAKANITSSYTIPVDQPTMGISDLAIITTEKLKVNYRADRLLIGSNTSHVVKVELSNMAGRLVASQQVELNAGYGELTVSQLVSGCYIARITDEHGHKATCKFIKP